jgi:DNA-binding NtrC family response regulator
VKENLENDQNKKTWVVDDEDCLITILKQNLEFQGYKVKNTNLAIEILLRLEQ